MEKQGYDRKIDCINWFIAPPLYLEGRSDSDRDHFPQ